MNSDLALLLTGLSHVASDIRWKTAAKAKHMVIMIGGPASGKGFNTGKGGSKLPGFTKGLIDADDAAGGHKEESDENLRTLQAAQAMNHHRKLVEAKGAGNCDDVMGDHWYKTKDGDKKNLGDSTSCDDVPDDFKEFYDGNDEFYASMRSWHDDVDNTHTAPPAPPELDGKPVERYKDEARTMFDRRVQNMIEAGEEGFLVLDSAGEDIDVQDFEGQIAHAQANGYEVTVVHLDIDPEDTKLANLMRGAKGNRMVDVADIDNYFETEPKELKDILGAQPDRYLHFTREGEGALTPDDRADAKKHIEAYREARLSGASEKELNAIEKKVNKYLFRPQYNINLETSDLISEDYDQERVDKIIGEMTKKNKDKADEEEAKAKPKKEDEEKPKGRDKAKDDGKHTYKDYVEDKKQKGDRPLNKDDWEARVMPKAASVSIRRLAQLVKGADKEETKEEKGYVQKTLSALFEDVKDDLGKKIEGYDVEYDMDKFDLYIRLKGGAASGVKDISALKSTRKTVEKKFGKGLRDLDGFKMKVTASRRGDDLVIQCHIYYAG